MATRRIKLISAAALVVMGGLGYHLFSATAQTAPPELAQAPLNAARSIPPAFIMAVDDSGSMDFETLFSTNDGSAWWHSGNRTFVGLNRSNEAAAGVLNFNQGGAANDTWKKYPYLFPFGADGTADGRRNNDGTNDHFAIPAIPAYGWARSPDINKAYFDPLETYQPWIESDGRFLQGIAGINASTGQVDKTSAPGDPKRGTTRLNLTADFAYDGHANARFMFYGGMSIPRGTRYKSVSCAEGGRLDTGNDAADATGYLVANADRTVTRTGGNASRYRCGVSLRYFPATFYVLESRAASVASAIGYRAASIMDDGARTPDGLALRKFEIRPDNFDSGYDRTIDNFANWFTYYRKRHQAARAALTLAFADQNMSVRAGYIQINGLNTVTMRRMNNASERASLYTSFFGLNTNGGTPNKEAVNHLGKQFQRTYQEGVSPVQLSCQKNYGMLFTDGFSNVWDGAGVGNVDGNDAVLFPSPLSDSTSNTMADIAAYYYKNSLGDSFPPAGGKVPVDSGCSSATPDPRLDCRDTPHMNLYGVTLGAQGLIYGSPGFEAQTSNPWANPPTWPTQFYARHPSAVDDIWHATMNSRGRFINASSSGDLVRAIQEVVQAVNSGKGTTGGFALTGARVGSGSLTVEPFYEAVNNTDWYGKLTAQTVTANPVSGQVSYAFKWDAGNQMPQPADRNILFGRPSSSVDPQAAEFTGAGLAEAGITSLDTFCSGSMAPAACTPTNLAALGVTLDQAVEYLRGNRSLEGTRLRARSAVLGDIINSSPAISASIDDYGYRSLVDAAIPTLATGYRAYLESKAEAGRSTVLVGANDGMLHAFDGADGEELFAYMPATAIGHLGNLLFPRNPDPNAGQKFEHRYYVDGQITVSDIYTGTAWRTVAVVSAGAGGRSVFALNITDPDNIEVLWEINDLISSTPSITDRIGHVLGKPVIVPVKATATAEPSWKAIFGNGYNSVSQKATLFVVDIATGVVETIVAEEAAPNDAAAHNGLGNIVVLDRWRHGSSGALMSGRDGFADTVYGADQNGAVWKFNLLNNSVGLGGEPLFVARDSGGNRQPITGGLEVAAGPGTAAMLYFGTGSYAFNGDGTSVSQQTLYAVIDRGVAVSGDRADGALLEQTVGDVTGVFRATSRNVITGMHQGWYIDLPTGQRMVGYPRIESGVIFFPVYEPSTQQSNPCSPGGGNWLYGLNALSGAAALTNVRIGSPTGTSPGSETGALKLDTGTSTAPVKDVEVLTTPRVSPLTGTDPDDLADALAARCSMVIQVAGAPPLYMPRPCGRQSWRQVR